MNENDSKFEDNKSILAVASVALLLGAISAKNAIRKKRYENSWLNHSRLENELYFDLANTTISPSQFDYGSFATPWSGDLDKFDV
mmetsp:Transcript_14668/g.17859  ORF Transcript_14668/g.17859 Transcript_14668/m.17859 type:complete len:85 (-) Transcript_14668:132-386(-)